jgi:bacterioferritin-associated ferredoxin
MFACICHAVSVEEVETAVDAGAATIEELGALTRAGTSCGSCQDHLDEIIDARCATCPLLQLSVA